MKKGRRDKDSKSFVGLSRKMLYSEEWRNLSPKAKIFYIQLKAKFNGSNNGEIVLRYSELEKVKGLSSDATISGAIKELEKKEWIKRENPGGLSHYTNKYKLTGKYDDYVYSRC